LNAFILQPTNFACCSKRQEQLMYMLGNQGKKM
jgi:hypothetical protein